MALNLDRSLEYSPEIAQEYVVKLRESQQIPFSIQSPEELTKYLSQHTNFLYRFTKNSDMSSEENVLKSCGIDLEQLENTYNNLPTRAGMRKSGK